MDRKIDQFTATNPVAIKPPKWKFLDYIRWAIGRDAKTIAQLIERNGDLHLQNERLRRSRLISPEEEASFARLVREHRELKMEQDAVVEWLRTNDPGMRNQQYAGLSFSQMVIKLIGGK